MHITVQVLPELICEAAATLSLATFDGRDAVRKRGVPALHRSSGASADLHVGLQQPVRIFPHALLGSRRRFLLSGCYPLHHSLPSACNSL